MVAVVSSTRSGSPSIYHIECEVPVSTANTSKRCFSCTRHRKSLASMVACTNRPIRDDPTHPSSHTTYAALRTPEKDERLRRLHLESRKSKQQIGRLRDKIAASIHVSSAGVDELMDEDLRAIVGRREDDLS